MLVSVSQGAKHALAQHFLGPSPICIPKGGGSLDGKLLLVSCGCPWVSYYQDQFAAELKSVLFINSKLGVKERCN